MVAANDASISNSESLFRKLFYLNHSDVAQPARVRSGRDSQSLPADYDANDLNATGHVRSCAFDITLSNTITRVYFFVITVVNIRSDDQSSELGASSMCIHTIDEFVGRHLSAIIVGYRTKLVT